MVYYSMSGLEEVVAAVTYSPEEDLFLLLKRSDSKEYFPGKWGFPAGFVEGDDIVEEALRELEEETGFVGEPVRRGESFHITTNTGEVRVHPVLVRVEYETPELSREHTKHRWIRKERIKELETVKGLQTDLENVGVRI